MLSYCECKKISVRYKIPKRFRWQTIKKAPSRNQLKILDGSLCYILQHVFTQIGQIIRRLLIDVVVQPIAEEKISVRSPRMVRHGTYVIVGEIIAGNLRLKTAVHVAEILVGERLAVIF